MEPEYEKAFGLIRQEIQENRVPLDLEGIGKVARLVEEIDANQKQQTGLPLRDDAYVFLTANLYSIGLRPWNIAHPNRDFVEEHRDALIDDFTHVCIGASAHAKQEELVSIPARLILRDVAYRYELLTFPSVNIWG